MRAWNRFVNDNECAMGCVALMVILALYVIAGTIEWYGEQAYLQEVSAYEVREG